MARAGMRHEPGPALLSPVDPALLPLTGLRGIAALWVMLSHCSYFFEGLQTSLWSAGRWLQLGWTGVLMFFVLSGFLLALPYVESQRTATRRPDLAAYLVRRVFRVFPAYWMQLALLVAVGWWFGGMFAVQDVNTLVAHLGMWFNLGLEPVRPLLGVWWTLPVEFAFYLTLPLLARMLALRHGALWILCVGLLVSLLQHALVWDLPWQERGSVVTQFPGYLVLFTMGVCAAWYRQPVQRYLAAHPGSSLRWSAGALLVLLGLLALIPLEDGGREFWEQPWMYFLWKPAVGAAIVMLLLSLLDPANPLAVQLRSSIAAHLGDISYSIYLWHLPTILAITASPAIFGVGAWWHWVVAIISTWVLALTSARWVERPGIQLGRVFAARVRSSAEA